MAKFSAELLVGPADLLIPLFFQVAGFREWHLAMGHLLRPKVAPKSVE